MSSRIRLAAIVVVAAFAGGACSGAASPSVTAPPATAAPPAAASDPPAPELTGLLAKIKADGKMTVGTSGAPPLSYIDSATQTPSGVLTDVLIEFLKRQGIDAKIDMVTMQFGSLIPAIQSGQ